MKIVKKKRHFVVAFGEAVGVHSNAKCSRDIHGSLGFLDLEASIRST